MKNKVELLAPAGDLERLKIAILYGADAVFVGGKKFSLRAKANNFSLEDLKEAVAFANFYHAKVHVTVNIVPYDDDFEGLDDYLLTLDQIGIHAIIVSSIYVLRRAKQLHCSFEVHMSTQLSIANSQAIAFFKECGADRVVLARELSIEEIKKIKEKSELPIEVFIHGGMCSSFSGRCTLSNVMANRDANKGGCAHSCRWNYYLYQQDRPLSNEKVVLASTDLMSVDHILSLIQIGVNSFKIEGRMKSVHYIASVVSCYRRLIDECYEKKKMDEKRLEEYKMAIRKAENRITSSGFLNQPLLHQGLLENINVENPTQSFLAIVTDELENTPFVQIEVRNHFVEGCKVEFLKPNGEMGTTIIEKMVNSSNMEVKVANHPKEILKIKCAIKLPKNTLIRKEMEYETKE